MLSTAVKTADRGDMGQPNRRRAPRVPVVALASLEVRGSVNSNDQAMASVRDLSRTGIGLETGQPPLKGQTVLLRLSLGEEIVELTTRVTRVEQLEGSHFFHVGLDWSDCSEEQLAFLDSVLDSVNDKKAIS